MSAPGDLCTRGDVLAAINNHDLDETGLAMIDRLITAASAALSRVAGREFATLDVDEVVEHEGTGTDPVEVVTYVPADDVVRRFEIPDTPWSPDVTVVHVGDLAALTRVDIVTPGGATVEADIDLADVEASPLNRRPWEPITALVFHRRLDPAHRVDVTGRWGFPLVPDDIRQACIAQVREWYVRDPSRFGEAFAEATDIAVPARELSLVARDAARAYRVPVVA